MDSITERNEVWHWHWGEKARGEIGIQIIPKVFIGIEVRALELSCSDLETPYIQEDWFVLCLERGIVMLEQISDEKNLGKFQCGSHYGSHMSIYFQTCISYKLIFISSWAQYHGD